LGEEQGKVNKVHDPSLEKELSSCLSVDSDKACGAVLKKLLIEKRKLSSDIEPVNRL
jgi:LDH2 family malate/lactate/ureidoglycolate dehydrogenase